MKLSAKAFWIGLPGAMKCQSMPVSLHQASMALQVNSVPLSETIEPGLPRRSTISRQFPSHPPPGDRRVRDRAQAFLGDVVDDVEDAEAPSIGELIRRRSRGTSGAFGFLPPDRRPGPCRLAAGPTLADSEPFLPIEAELLVVDPGRLALPPQQHEQPAIAEPAAFLGDRPHPLPKAGFVGPGRLVSHGHAAAADGFTRPPFAHPEGASEMGDSFPLGRGRHHFFPTRSFKAALSSMASANSHLVVAHPTVAGSRAYQVQEK